MRVLLWGLPHHDPVLPSTLAAIESIDLVVVDDEETAAREAATADVLVMTPNRYTDAVEKAVVAAGRLGLLQSLSAGYEALLDRQLPPGTLVATAGDTLSPAVAEQAIAHALILLRRLDVAIRSQTRSAWEREAFQTAGTLDGRRAAVVGFGSIGKAIATRLRAFGTHVTGVSRHGTPDPAADGMRPIAQLDSVLAESDLIFIALSLTDETAGLFDRERIARCKQGAMIVNIARGKIIDTDALVDALNSGHLGGAGLDVTDPEPLPRTIRSGTRRTPSSARIMAASADRGASRPSSPGISSASGTASRWRR